MVLTPLVSPAFTTACLWSWYDDLYYICNDLITDKNEMDLNKTISMWLTTEFTIK